MKVDARALDAKHKARHSPSSFKDVFGDIGMMSLTSGGVSQISPTSGSRRLNIPAE